MVSLIGVNVTPEPDSRSPGAPETRGQVQGTPRLVPGPTPVPDTGRNAVALGPLDPSGWPKCLDFELKRFCFLPDGLPTAQTTPRTTGGEGGVVRGVQGGGRQPPRLKVAKRNYELQDFGQTLALLAVGTLVSPLFTMLRSKFSRHVKMTPMQSGHRPPTSKKV
jgi:hypothetical protein